MPLDEIDPSAIDKASFQWGHGLVKASLNEFKAMRDATLRARSPTAEPPLHTTREQRIRGWLKHVWRKATTEEGDDWSMDGTGPHEWWDKLSGPPMTSFQRFDLHEASYPLALLSQKTPAWREGYAEILEKLSARYTTFWGAVDWLTQFGDDPSRDKYPTFWKGTIIPAGFWGSYNTPGWTGNGTGEKGIEPDPIQADGMLFFKGFMLLLMSITTKVGGREAAWRKPWFMAGVGDSQHSWTLRTLADHLQQQWADQECGLH